MATRTIASITDNFALFTRSPFIGKIFASELKLNVRTFVVAKHIIFYTPRPNEILILRVIHASRDARAVFEQFINELEL